jgi:hypothetical protein
LYRSVGVESGCGFDILPLSLPPGLAEDRNQETSNQRTERCSRLLSNNCEYVLGIYLGYVSLTLAKKIEKRTKKQKYATLATNFDRKK